MALNDAWNEQWTAALVAAKWGIEAFERRCATSGIKNEAERAAADAELALSITQCALLCGMPWTDETINRARHVLGIASTALDMLERERGARN